MPTGNLPKEGKQLWEKVYKESLKGSCSGDEACAAKSAWKAVSNAGWKKKEGKWVRSANLVEFSLRVEKASFDKRTQERRWRAVTSDVDTDHYNDNMSLDLYEDFLQRIESKELIPEEFRSDFWQGGMPYISISHYDDLDGKGVPGDVDQIYVDGKFLKAKGLFYDTPLGIKCFDALCDDLYNEKSESKDKVRISIGFLDWAHKHKSDGEIFERESIDDICPQCLLEFITGDESGLIYLKGHLIHLALTRVPVNERTLMEVDRSMTTQKEDAETIVGEEHAEELDELQKAKGANKGKAMVTLSEGDEEEITEPLVNEGDYKKDEEKDEEEDDEKEDKKKKKEKSEVLIALTAIDEKLNRLVNPVAPEVEPHILDDAIAGVKQQYSQALASELTPDEKLKVIQESYNQLGEVIVNTVKSETVQETPEPQNADNSQFSELTDVMKGLAQRMDLLIASQQSNAQVVSGPTVPQPRSFQAQPFIPDEQPLVQNESSTPKLRDLVNRSVGLG